MALEHEKAERKRKSTQSDGSDARLRLRKSPMTFKAMISLAILNSPEQKLTLAEIYQFIAEEFSEFTKSRSGWKNTVRHNLSIHECFVKGELAPPGKSCFWRIHRSFAENFNRGDFSRRSIKIVDKPLNKRFEERCRSTPEEISPGMRERCDDVSSQDTPRFQSGLDRNDYLVYPTWKASEEQQKVFVAEATPFCERYYCDGKQLCISVPHVVGYDEYLLPGSRMQCACNTYHDCI
jgi:hypothetical protein